MTFTWVALRITDFRRTQKMLAWLNPLANGFRENGAGPASTADTALAIAKTEAAAARHVFFQPNCLENSLALWALLRRGGINAELQLGGRKNAGTFIAHAWVEYGGLVLGDFTGELHKYARFEDLPTSVETQRR